jgi:RNA polymerase-binding transcription factor DksA
MAAQLDRAQVAGFRHQLQQRLAARREEVRELLLRSDREPYQELAGAVQDTADRSLADLLVDVNLAEVDRHIDEIRALERALERIAGGGYGECIDCGGAIELGRLRAAPTALRCAECQARRERTYAQPGHPKL